MRRVTSDGTGEEYLQRHHLQHLLQDAVAHAPHNKASNQIQLLAAYFEDVVRGHHVLFRGYYHVTGLMPI